MYIMSNYVATNQDRLLGLQGQHSSWMCAASGPLPTVDAAAMWLFILGVAGSAVGSVAVECKACADTTPPLPLWRDIDLMLAGLPILRPAFIEEIRQNHK